MSCHSFFRPLAAAAASLALFAGLASGASAETIETKARQAIIVDFNTGAPSRRRHSLSQPSPAIVPRAGLYSQPT